MTFDPEVDVGLPGRLELGVAVPAISLLRDRTIGGDAIHGIGDSTQTGALGITVQGPVLTAGTSVVRAVGQAQVGGEFFLAWLPNATLGGSNAGGQIGGNVPLGERATLDLGVGVGGLSASPRWWFQAGLSVDVVRR